MDAFQREALFCSSFLLVERRRRGLKFPSAEFSIPHAKQPPDLSRSSSNKQSLLQVQGRPGENQASDSTAVIHGLNSSSAEQLPLL